MGFLEESDSESETETEIKPKAGTEAEAKPKESKSDGKNKRQSKEEKEGKFLNLLSQLPPNMVTDGIKAIEKEIEDYEKENKKHVILKDSSDDLNKKLNRYGLKFKTRTLVSSVLKKLKEHKVRLENNHDVGKIQGKLADFKKQDETSTKDSNKRLEAKEI